jgi:hypothetical protein
MIAQHSQVSNEHYTAPEILRRARAVLGSIALDPASNSRANQLVQADRFYSPADDGLSQDWTAPTLWLNPPGGSLRLQGRSLSQQAIWLDRLEQFYRLGRVDHALFLSFNLEILRHRPWLLSAPIAVFRERPRFWSWNDETQSLTQGQWSTRGADRVWTDHPSHACLIACLSDCPEVLARFAQHFGDQSFATVGHCYPVVRFQDAP